MKNFFLIICLLSSPVLLLAQQKSNPQKDQDQIRKEMDALRMEMQQKIQLLQDSLARMQEQLAEQQRSSPDKFFHYKSPDKGDYYFSIPDSFNWDHSFNFDFSWPKDGFNWVIPPQDEIPTPPSQPYEYHFEL